MNLEQFAYTLMLLCPGSNYQAVLTSLCEVSSHHPHSTRNVASFVYNGWHPYVDEFRQALQRKMVTV